MIFNGLAPKLVASALGLLATIPAAMAGQAGRLELGTPVDADSTYINGQLVGTTAYQYPPRKYDFGPGVPKAGKNVVAVRLISNGGRKGCTVAVRYAWSDDPEDANLYNNEGLPASTFRTDDF